jgi:hypothetical protein
MMHRRNVAGLPRKIALAVACAALACSGCQGGEVDGARTDGGAGHAPQQDAAVLGASDAAAPTAPTLALGSYDIVGGESAHLPCQTYPTAWTRGTYFRLDLLSTTRAVVWTPGTAIPSMVRFEPDGVFTRSTNADCASPNEPPLAVEPLTGSWMYIPVWAFDLDDLGMPIAARAISAEDPLCGQAVSTTASFAGTVQPDHTAPDFSFVTEPQIDGLALPWDVVALAASEGLEPSAWLAKTSASLDGEALQLVPVALEGTSEVNRLELPAQGWIERNGRVLRVEVSSAVSDRSGNAGEAVSFEHTFADVGEPVRGVTFMDGMDALLIGMEVRPVGDSDCEADMACAVSLDGASGPGLAVRLDTRGAESVRIRYAIGGPALAARLVAPSGMTVESPPAPESGEWNELELPIPEAADEVGLTLRKQYESCFGGGTKLVIGSITVH